MTQKYFDLINERAKYGPDPPPVIVRSSESETQPDYFNIPPIIWLRRPAPYNLPSTVPKSYGSDLDLNINVEGRMSDFFPSLKNSSLIKYLNQKNISAITVWIQAYTLKMPDENFNLISGLLYLSKIEDDGTEYPKEILEKITNLLDKRTNIYPSMDIFPTSVYWMRSFRFERKRLDILLPKLDLFNLYFITSNPFERYAARKLLSYYTDKELHKQFNYDTSSKGYFSKKIQLDAIVSLSLYQFGYFTIENWSTPVRIIFNFPQMNEMSKTYYQLTDLIQQIYESKLDDNLLMPILRLTVQIYSSWPWIKDKSIWERFLLASEKYGNIFNSISERYKIKGFPTGRIPYNFESLEQSYDICLLCEQTRPKDYFGLCGHGVCMGCQGLLGTSKCPFCTEHFVAEAINNQYVSTVTQVISVTDSLRRKINDISIQKKDRKYRFDWSSGDIYLPF